MHAVEKKYEGKGLMQIFLCKYILSQVASLSKMCEGDHSQL